MNDSTAIFIENAYPNVQIPRADYLPERLTNSPLARQEKETGLEFAVARAIIEAHGDTIEAIGSNKDSPGIRLEILLPFDCRK